MIDVKAISASNDMLVSSQLLGHTEGTKKSWLTADLSPIGRGYAAGWSELSYGDERIQFYGLEENRWSMTNTRFCHLHRLCSAWRGQTECYMFNYLHTD